MLEKFNGIFYLIIYLIHFIGVGVSIISTQSTANKLHLITTALI